jgi:hypothetical protein
MLSNLCQLYSTQSIGYSKIVLATGANFVNVVVQLRVEAGCLIFARDYEVVVIPRAPAIPRSNGDSVSLRTFVVFNYSHQASSVYLRPRGASCVSPAA